MVIMGKEIRKDRSEWKIEEKRMEGDEVIWGRG